MKALYTKQFIFTSCLKIDFNFQMQYTTWQVQASHKELKSSLYVSGEYLLEGIKHTFFLQRQPYYPFSKKQMQLGKI